MQLALKVREPGFRIEIEIDERRMKRALDQLRAAEFLVQVPDHVLIPVVNLLHAEAARRWKQPEPTTN
jgi:hypothetical protein